MTETSNRDHAGSSSTINKPTLLGNVAKSSVPYRVANHGLCVWNTCCWLNLAALYMDHQSIERISWFSNRPDYRCLAP